MFCIWVLKPVEFCLGHVFKAWCVVVSSGISLAAFLSERRDERANPVGKLQRFYLAI